MGKFKLPEDIEFSNPRRRCAIPDWPMAHERGTAHFFILTDYTRGEQIGRIVGDNGKAKASIFAERWLIVDGSDGKTYILGRKYNGMIVVGSADLKHYKDVGYRFSELFQQVKA